MDRPVDCRLTAEHIGLAYRLLIAATGPSDEVIALLAHEIADALPDDAERRTDEAVQTLYALAIVAANQMLNAHDLLATSRRPVPADRVERLRTSLAATLDDAVELFARRDGATPGPGETTG